MKIPHTGQYACIELWPNGSQSCIIDGVNVKFPHVSCYRVVSVEEHSSSHNTRMVIFEFNVTINDPASYSTKLGRNWRDTKLVVAWKIMESIMMNHISGGMPRELKTMEEYSR